MNTTANTPVNMAPRPGLEPGTYGLTVRMGVSPPSQQLLFPEESEAYDKPDQTQAKCSDNGGTFVRSSACDMAVTQGNLDIIAEGRDEMVIDGLLEQERLEREMVESGIATYRSNLNKAISKGREHTTHYGQVLLKNAIEPVSRMLVEHVTEAFSGKPGRMAVTAPLMGMLEPDKAAFQALRIVIDGVSARYPLTKVAMTIGAVLEDEAKFAAFEQKEPAWFRTIMRDVNRRNLDRHHKRYAILHTMTTRAMVEFELWSKTEKLHVGTKMIDFIIQATGLVQIQTQTLSRTMRQTFIVATEKTLDWIEKVNRHGELLSPTYLPCVIPPKDWSSPTDGGYHFKHVRQVPMIKTHNRRYLEEMHNVSMPTEYRAINALQKTRWAVNDFILTVMQTAWDSGLDLPGIPSRNDIPIPPYPLPSDLDKESMTDEQKRMRLDWKHMAARLHSANHKQKSKRLQFVRTLQLAQRFAEYEEFYFPYQCDFRGRKYTVVSFLTPQGAPYAKSLLHFAHGMPIENETHLKWLLVQGANTYGIDKVSMVDRQLWVYMHKEEIIRSAEDPLGEKFWQQADEPWQFLAFCNEFAEFDRVGFGFMSRLPIALDGSNNGLQHFSAQLRDEIGGAATNLIPLSKPADIYQEVADRVNDYLRERAEAGEEIAAQWLRFGVNRSCAKRPVMVRPYGGQRYSTREYIEDYVISEVEKGKESPWGTDLFGPTTYLTELMWTAINQVVVAAGKAMDWIQAVARDVAKLNLPLTWATPSGFVVFQQYPETVSRRVTTYIDGQMVKPQINVQDYTRVDKRRSVNGASPNFVHSMDAAAMTLTICNTLDHFGGHVDFAMIHDSYGVHAARTEEMSQIIRDTFVDMYLNMDVLEQFKQSALRVLDQVPDIPARGQLDIEQVRRSEFFFA